MLGEAPSFCRRRDDRTALVEKVRDVHDPGVGHLGTSVSRMLSPGCPGDRISDSIAVTPSDVACELAQVEQARLDHVADRRGARPELLQHARQHASERREERVVTVSELGGERGALFDERHHEIERSRCVPGRTLVFGDRLPGVGDSDLRSLAENVREHRLYDLLPVLLELVLAIAEARRQETSVLVAQLVELADELDEL
ncbi:hypothetical protein K2Z84_12310 [Candidatus Binatia bacterium]|nr:hypothetical protein [Candidatus Binatia bacterium]